MQETRIGNNYMVQIKTAFKGLWDKEYFIDEKSAREYANDQYVTGAVVVGLWYKTRNGYRLIKEVKQSENEARARREIYMAKLAEKVGCTISKSFAE